MWRAPSVTTTTRPVARAPSSGASFCPRGSAIQEQFRCVQGILRELVESPAYRPPAFSTVRDVKEHLWSEALEDVVCMDLVRAHFAECGTTASAQVVIVQRLLTAAREHVQMATEISALKASNISLQGHITAYRAISNASSTTRKISSPPATPPSSSSSSSSAKAVTYDRTRDPRLPEYQQREDSLRKDNGELRALVADLKAARADLKAAHDAERARANTAVARVEVLEGDSEYMKKLYEDATSDYKAVACACKDLERESRRLVEASRNSEALAEQALRNLAELRTEHEKLKADFQGETKLLKAEHRASVLKLTNENALLTVDRDRANAAAAKLEDIGMQNGLTTDIFENAMAVAENKLAELAAARDAAVKNEQKARDEREQLGKDKMLAEIANQKSQERLAEAREELARVKVAAAEATEKGEALHARLEAEHAEREQAEATIDRMTGEAHAEKKRIANFTAEFWAMAKKKDKLQADNTKLLSEKPTTPAAPATPTTPATPATPSPRSVAELDTIVRQRMQLEADLNASGARVTEISRSRDQLAQRFEAEKAALLQRMQALQDETVQMRDKASRQLIIAETHVRAERARSDSLARQVDTERVLHEAVQNDKKLLEARLQTMQMANAKHIQELRELRQAGASGAAAPISAQTRGEIVRDCADHFLVVQRALQNQLRSQEEHIGALTAKIASLRQELRDTRAAPAAPAAAPASAPPVTTAPATVPASAAPASAPALGAFVFAPRSVVATSAPLPDDRPAPKRSPVELARSPVSAFRTPPRTKGNASDSSSSSDCDCFVTGPTGEADSQQAAKLAHSTLQKKHDMAAAALARANEKTTVLKAELAGARKELAASKATAKAVQFDLVRELSARTTKLSDTKNTLSATTSKLNDTENTLAERTADLAQKEDLLARAMSAISASRADMAKAESTAKKESEKLAAEAEARGVEISQLKQRVQVYLDEIEHLKRVGDTLWRGIHDRDSQLRLKDCELEARAKELKDKAKELKDKTKELKDTAKKLKDIKDRKDDDYEPAQKAAAPQITHTQAAAALKKPTRKLAEKQPAKQKNIAEQIQELEDTAGNDTISNFMDAFEASLSYDPPASASSAPHFPALPLAAAAAGRFGSAPAPVASASPRPMSFSTAPVSSAPAPHASLESAANGLMPAFGDSSETAGGPVSALHKRRRARTMNAAAASAPYLAPLSLSGRLVQVPVPKPAAEAGKAPSLSATIMQDRPTAPDEVVKPSMASAPGKATKRSGRPKRNTLKQCEA